MKMNYRQDKQKKSNWFHFLLPLVAIVAVVYFFSKFFPGSGFGVLSTIANPIWTIEERMVVGVNNIHSYFTSKESLAIENVKLKEDLDSMKVELDSYTALETENRDLMIEMGSNGTPPDLLLATVLSGPNLPPYDSLIINLGKKDGIQVGDKVLYSNVVIGEIYQTLHSSSKVRLYSTSGVRTDVLILSSGDYVHATAIGFGGGDFYIELPSDIKITSGASVLIPNAELNVLGRVDFIAVDQTTSLQRILVRFPFNMKSVRFVRVRKNSVNDQTN